MDTQEANFQQQKRLGIEDLSLNCESEERGTAHPNNKKSLRDFDEKPIREVHFHSHSFIHKKINIKVDQGVEYTYGFNTGEHFVKPEFVLPEEVGIKVEDQEGDQSSNEKSQNVNFSSNTYVKSEHTTSECEADEPVKQLQNSKFSEDTIKEESFAETKFLIHGEVDIKSEDERVGQSNINRCNENTIKNEHLMESKIIVQEELEIKDEDEGQDQFIAKSAVGQVTNRHHPSSRTVLLNQMSTNNRSFHLPESPIFKCVNCTYQTHQKENITSHVLSHTEKTLKCSQCSYETNNKKLLRQHELVHVPKEKVKLHQCPECSFTSVWKGNLTQHMIKHKNTGNVYYKCTLCCYQSSWKSHLTRHIQHIHKSKDIQPIPCQEDGCSYKTPHESYLVRHMRLMHECKTMLKCSKCSYQTKYPKTLKAHELEHEDTSKWFSCTLCPHKTTSAALLKQHMLVHKTGSEIKWFHCSKCPFKTKRNCTLNRHKLVHDLNPRKIFKCSECSYKTVYAFSFRDHRLVHKKPEEIGEWFNCYLCTLRTTRKGNLAKHIQKMHRDSNGRINNRANMN